MSEAGLKVQSFETGAVRSTERQGFRYDLITPLGLKAMANYYRTPPMLNKTVDQFLSICLDKTYQFLANPGPHHPLYQATDAILCATAVDRRDHDMDHAPFSNGLNYHLIPKSALKRVAAAYDEGAKKYSAFNCEKGLPVGDILNHGIAHVLDWLNGDTSEDHLGHGCWNYLMAIHNLFAFPDMDHGLRQVPITLVGYNFDV